MPNNACPYRLSLRGRLPGMMTRYGALSHTGGSADAGSSRIVTSGVRGDDPNIFAQQLDLETVLAERHA